MLDSLLQEKSPIPKAQNYKYDESSVYLPLVCVKDDFTSIVESLANKYHYDLSIMGNLLDGNAVIGSTFFEDATYGYAQAIPGYEYECSPWCC